MIYIDIYSREAMGNWLKYKTISDKIATEPIDPYLYYRLIYPGYESWAELSINLSRNLKALSQNLLLKTALSIRTALTVIHLITGNQMIFFFMCRGSLGGTYFYLMENSGR